MSKDQNPSDKTCDAYFDNPYAATSGSYYSDRVTFYAGFAAGAASRDAEIAELVAALEGVPNLITVMRMPNIEHIADNHNRAVHGLRQALAKVRNP